MYSFFVHNSIVVPRSIRICCTMDVLNRLSLAWIPPVTVPFFGRVRTILASSSKRASSLLMVFEESIWVALAGTELYSTLFGCNLRLGSTILPVYESHFLRTRRRYSPKNLKRIRSEIRILGFNQKCLIFSGTKWHEPYGIAWILHCNIPQH